MFKTYILGVILGIAAAIAGAVFLPVVDQVRENSVVRVAPNGGITESFHINIPIDRVASGSESAAVPEGLEWPAELASTRADLYKIRNVHDEVIGVGSRVTVQDEQQGNAIEWVLHFPARGSVYVSMATRQDDGTRTGVLRAGTREFSNTLGRLTERYVQAESEEGQRRGRIELQSFLTRQRDGA